MPLRVDPTLLLTNRITATGAKPMTAREYWRLRGRVGLDALAQSSATELGQLLGSATEAERVVTLLDAAGDFEDACETLRSRGLRLLSCDDEAYPQGLLRRLSQAAPPMLYVTGPVEWLQGPLLGVVGSRGVDQAGSEVALRVAEVAQRVGAGIVSGGAKGVDGQSMRGGLEADLPVVGVPAEGLERASRRRELRDAVTDERLLLVSPYAPGAGFSVGNAMGRNKLIYGLAAETLVVASEVGSGGTWAGADEALRRGFGSVCVWAGEGGGPGNPVLIERGGSAIDSLESWSPSLSMPPPHASEQLDLDI